MFYSHVSNAIVAFPMIYEGEAVSQSRNLGSGEYYGAEASAAARLSPAFSLGGNYTWTHRDLDAHHVLTDGFPGRARSFFAGLNAAY